MPEKVPNPGQYQKVADLLKEITAQSKELELSETSIAQIEGLILDRRIKSAKELTNIVNQKVKEDAAARRIETTEKGIVDLRKQGADLLDKLKKPMSLLGKSGKEQLSNLSDQVKANEKKLAGIIKIGGADEAAIAKAQEQIDAQKRQIKNISTINKKSPELSNSLGDAAKAANGLAESVQGVFDDIPGGDFLSRALGVDKLDEAFDTAMTAGTSAVADALANGATEAEAMAAGGKAFSDALKINPLALVVMAAMKLVKIFKGVSEDASKLAEETGMTYAQSKNLVKESHNVASSMNTQLATAKEIQTVLSATASEWGTSAMLSAEQAANVADMGEAFGYGAQQAAEVNNAFMMMGASAETASDAQGEVAKMALLAGVNVGTVTKDIAENAAEVSKYFKGDVKNLGKAAVEAAKMGVSLKTMANVADKLLDFEESIAAQFEFQALTGKQMNLDEARRLALKGDIAGATKALLGEVGSLADLQALGPLEMEALEKATGMTSQELLKQATIQEKLGDLTEDQKAAMSGLNLTAAELASKSPEQLKALMAQEQKSQQIAAQWENFKSTLVSAVMPIAEALMSVFQAILPVLKLAGNIIKFAFAPIQIAVEGLQEVWEWLGSIGGEATVLGGIFGKIGDFVGAISEGLGEMKQWLQENETVMAILKTIFTFIAFGAIPSLVTGLWSMGAALIPVIAGALSAAAGFLMTAVGAVFSTFAAIPFGLGIPLAIASIAGLFALFSSAKGNDVISGPAHGGSAGYGSRVLFGPEGAISFNNKDTIVAGTNLFANDMILAPPGAMKMNDGAVGGDMPDPPEAKVVGVTDSAVIKLSAGIALALGTAITTALVTTLPIALGAALTLVMPILGATMVASMVTAAAMTALIPKPVLLMNPFVATFEMNPMTYSMMGMMGGVVGGMASLFGGKDKEEDPVLAKLEEVKQAILNMDIKMDGQKVGMITRIADTFRRK